MVANVTVSPKFQITIPKEVREAFGIKAGDELVWYDDGGSLVLTRTIRDEEIDGFLVRLGYEPQHVDPHEIRDKDDREVEL